MTKHFVCFMDIPFKEFPTRAEAIQYKDEEIIRNNMTDGDLWWVDSYDPVTLEVDDTMEDEAEY